MNPRAEITKAILLVNSENPRDPDGWLVTDIYKQPLHSWGTWLAQHESLAPSRLHFRASCTPLSSKSPGWFPESSTAGQPIHLKVCGRSHTPHVPVAPPNHPDSVDTCQDLPSQEHPAPDSLEFSEIWSGEDALLQGLRNSTE